MYWCKIAQTEHEFEAIAALNYETFVEEIPQHTPTETRRLVDKFHSDNTYIVVYKDLELVGMLAVRIQRPFSLDGKIGEVEQYLNEEDCLKLCEIRLLSVKKQYRNGRVFLQLANALYRYVFDAGYSAAVISGTTREEKLYTQLGFEAFAPAVGAEEALFLPMVLRRADGLILGERLQRKDISFCPGPVAQKNELTYTALSHRSSLFKSLYDEMLSKLSELSGARYVTPVVGTGTLANDLMLGQIKAQFGEQRGLLLSNGEFGNRLVRQAQNWQLSFDVYDVPFSEPYSLEELETYLSSSNYAWLCVVHGETSLGICNNLEAITTVAQRYHVAVCADCISSFGTFPFTMDGLFMATAVSGKALGALGGLAFIFTNTIPVDSEAPLYSNLANYFKNQVPFTMPASFVASTVDALKKYPERYVLLQKRLKMLLNEPQLDSYRIKTHHYPIVVTYQFPEALAYFGRDARLNGFMLHDESGYLKQHALTQISMIQPHFEQDLQRLLAFLSNYETTIIPSEKRGI
ncbi:aminotransferase class V-fold PLP-dependent enzyme [Solibacillus sp. FSL H8-0538]|uniref:aminotransferase class V-fold PLP-dependent enzyme n=1 Tax=Solibacillus sp. FSL H8-0538 TaxID=2921400 RepID=UPI0030FB51D7